MIGWMIENRMWLIHAVTLDNANALIIKLLDVELIKNDNKLLTLEGQKPPNILPFLSFDIKREHLEKIMKAKITNQGWNTVYQLIKSRRLALHDCAEMCVYNSIAKLLEIEQLKGDDQSPTLFKHK